MGSPVSLVRSEHDETAIKNSVAKAIELVDFKPGKRLRTVVIKPNLNYYWEPSTGCTTDPRFVGAIIDYLRETYGRELEIKIAEADASAMRTKYVFPMLGYDKLAEDKGVRLLNLSQDDLKKESVTVNGREIEFQVPQSLKNSDLFINVPKLKTVRITKITCAMKNIFGCIGTPRKFAYHPFLNEAIVGINKILHPDLTVVDGLVGLGRFPVKLGLVMASTDVFSLDWIVAQITGYNPKSVEFLKIAMHENIGSSREISIRGEEIKEFKNRFPKESFSIAKMPLSMQLKILRLYRRISGDIIPPFLEED